MSGNETIGTIVFQVLGQLGITDYVIPFLLIFAALYAILVKTKILSENGFINFLVAFSIAYAFVALGAGKILNAMLPYFMMFAFILMILLLLYRFFGATEENIYNAFKNPIVILFVVGMIILTFFLSLQDKLIYMDKIPAWRVDENGTVLPEGQVSNATHRPNIIVVNGVSYTLINGIYYKQGYEGVAYAFGSPAVVGSIVIMIIIGIAVALILIPKN